jgi:predicted dehydrogenase
LTDKEDECKALLETQKKYGNKILVCHVLRYATAYLKLKEILDSGKLGRLVSINWVEPVGYWHQAHSYVRGNWRNTNHAAPMILAKCCHDLDLIQYFAESKCKSVSSVGGLTFFKSDCAPEGATERCTDCQWKDTCPYSAYRIYIERWKKMGSPAVEWPYNVLVSEPITEEKLLDALANGSYGRCVFHCDNNVVDHQSVQMAFENGVVATLHMNAFNQNSGRRVTLFGTYGMADMTEDEIVLNIYGEPAEVIDTTLHENQDGYAHGGGDARMIDALYGMISGERQLTTSLEHSVESHLIGIKAEQSRLEGGKLLSVHA